MATPNYSVLKDEDFVNKGQIVQWALGDADTGLPYENPSMNLRSIQFAGTFASATVVLEGSNDGTNYVTLLDDSATAISKTANALVNVQTRARYIRAKSSGGSGAAIIATLLAARVVR